MNALCLISALLGTLLCIASAQVMSIDEYKDLILEEHNNFRKQQGGSDMQKMIWSDAMEKEAERWVQRCRFEHEGKDYGENLAFSTGTDVKKMMKEAMQSWYDEIKMYNYNGKACAASCHYTQLVWAPTREVGCAMKRCPSLASFGSNVPDAWYFACWYTPKGNDMSEYPYDKTGAPCSKCWEGQSCENGLCAGEGKKPCNDKAEHCAIWLEMGECDRNPKYMKKNCAKSCNAC